MYTLEDTELVPNLAIRVCGGTVVHPNTYHWLMKGFSGGMFCFLPHISKMDNSEDKNLFPNFATRACGETVVYQNAYQEVSVAIPERVCFLLHVSKVYS